MRKLMWFGTGFGIACFAGAYLFYGYWPVLLTAVGLAFCLCLLIFRDQRRRCAVFACVGALTASLWFCIFDDVILKPVRMLNGQEKQVEITAEDYGKSLPYGCAVSGQFCMDGRTYRVKLSLYGIENIKPGDQICGTFEFQYTGPGSSRGTYYPGKGIFLTGHAGDDVQVISCQKIPFRYFPAQLRRNTTQILDRIFPESTIGFARALLLGDAEKLSYETDASLQVSGIRHVIAVSGLHVSILFGAVYVLCGKRRALTAILGIPVLVVFAAVAGFTPSIVRACIMQSLMILAMLFDKEYDPPTALAFAVLVLLTGNPLAVTSVGFQLTVCCMIGILLASNPIYSYLMAKRRWGRYPVRTFYGRVLSWLAASVSVTLGALLFTIPICAIYFHTVSLIGILTNLLTLWAISVVFCGIILGCIVGYLWLPAGVFVAQVISVLIDYCLFVAKHMSRFALASVYTDSVYAVFWLVFCYALLILALLCRYQYPWTVTACIMVGLALSTACSWIEPQMDSFRVSVLDVGQGQCVLLQCKDCNYLVDCGSHNPDRAADTAARVLCSQGIFHLNGVILTHFDMDHINGVHGLLTRISADRLYLPDVHDDHGLREEFAQKYSDRITWITKITEFSLAQGRMTVYPSQEGTSDNESGLCVLFQPEGYDILITGDRGFSGEKDLMNQVNLPKLELLVAGHHGSKNSTGMELLQTTCPGVVVISVGAHNSYGHPSTETLTRLNLFGCRVFRTDLDGTITFRG